jgi:hypothetical protein
VKQFYTYMYLREDGTPYYVGKGTARRVRTQSYHSVKVPEDKTYIVMQEFETEDDALFAEAFLIAAYGRKDNGTGILRNLTDGGEGISGYHHTETAKKAISEASKGHTLPEESKEKIRAAKRGIPRSEETKNLLSIRMKNLWKDTEFRERAEKINLGRKHSEEAKNKRRKIVCKFGHLLTKDNLYFYPSGQRSCKACRLYHSRKQEAKRKRAEE